MGEECVSPNRFENEFMTRPDDLINRPVQPPLTDLFGDYLRQQVSRQTAGLGRADSTDEVVPFEAVPVQPADAKLAWEEAVAVARYSQSGMTMPTWSPPPDWPAIVSSQEPAAALSFSFGNYPQLVQNVRSLLHATDLATLRPVEARSTAAPSVREWAAAVVKQPESPQLLLVVGILRLTKQFEEAAELLKHHRAIQFADWQAAWANEEAAVVWHRGQVQQAADLWEKQAPSVPVLFNRGMAALFLGKSAAARSSLTEAVDQLPEKDGWHHLGRLYLTLAEMV
jgi:hypothetical protein